MALQFKLDNELELVYAVVYQKVIQLPYVDNFLSELQAAFKKKFGDQLTSSQRFSVNYEFEREFRATLANAESSAKQSSKAPKTMVSNVCGNFPIQQLNKYTIFQLVYINYSS